MRSLLEVLGVEHVEAVLSQWGMAKYHSQCCSSGAGRGAYLVSGLGTALIEGLHILLQLDAQGPPSVPILAVLGSTFEPLLQMADKVKVSKGHKLIPSKDHELMCVRAEPFSAIRWAA